MFGGVVDIQDEAPDEAKVTQPKMPEVQKGPKSVEEFASGLEKSGVVPQGLIGDMQGVIESGKTGGIEAMIEKAKELEKKYPPVPSTSPSAMTTGDSSEGAPPPTPATPAPPAAPAPTPVAEMSNEDKIKQLEGYIEGNKKRFARREESAKRHIESFSRRYANDPERVQELKDDYAATLTTEKAEMESANAGFQSQIDALRKSGGSVSPEQTAPPAPSPTPSGGATGGGGTVTASAESAAPPSISAEPPTSGSSLSTASSEVAEAQRMESSADAGSVVNAPTNNSTTSSSGKEPSKIASAYDEEFAKLLATT
jgi:hypothetical protein